MSEKLHVDYFLSELIDLIKLLSIGLFEHEFIAVICFQQLGIDDKPWNKRSAKVDQANPSKSAKKLPLRGA